MIELAARVLAEIFPTQHAFPAKTLDHGLKSKFFAKGIQPWPWHTHARAIIRSVAAPAGYATSNRLNQESTEACQRQYPPSSPQRPLLIGTHSTRRLGQVSARSTGQANLLLSLSEHATAGEGACYHDCIDEHPLRGESWQVWPAATCTDACM